MAQYLYRVRAKYMPLCPNTSLSKVGEWDRQPIIIHSMWTHASSCALQFTFISKCCSVVNNVLLSVQDDGAQSQAQLLCFHSDDSNWCWGTGNKNTLKKHLWPSFESVCGPSLLHVCSLGLGEDVTAQPCTCAASLGSRTRFSSEIKNPVRDGAVCKTFSLCEHQEWFMGTAEWKLTVNVRGFTRSCSTAIKCLWLVWGNLY